MSFRLKPHLSDFGGGRDSTRRFQIKFRRRLLQAPVPCVTFEGKHIADAITMGWAKELASAGEAHEPSIDLLRRCWRALQGSIDTDKRALSAEILIFLSEQHR
jgi:hypothetical protein